ncbi:DNA internalization-related competence protein ComEC/Rec2 [Aerococcus sp. UMB1112A]|uniref:DNA internalization-related competence protein ComEC/Rec2 n=1 Tax=Aerococcus sp. UMB1112A TaxID=3050609 RepID=UPI00254D45C7|nr:DNA internalization-related competence protein ComEC/Rec2 [Aerococcus sp. UMB1112A]MDK8503220.1 DNA internalization-related competence protein ComEC/Rec2 [Aerococcus sp. UMB1112A]
MLDQLKSYHIVSWALVVLLAACLVLAPSLWSGGGLVILVLRLFYLKEPRYFRRTLVLVGICLAYFSWIRAGQSSLLAAGDFEGALAMDLATLQVDGDQAKFQGDLVLEEGQTERIQAFYRLGSEEEKATFEGLDQALTWQVRGELSRSQPNRNRYLFNYRAYLERQRIFYLVDLEAMRPVSVQGGWRARLAETQVGVRQALARLANDQVRAYVLALFFNDSQWIDPGAMDSYQTIGMIHLFSLSGFHVNFLLKHCRYVYLRLGGLVDYFDGLALVLLLVYGTLLAWPYGMVRAIGVYLYQVLCRALGRPPSSLEGTAWALIILLWLKPFALFSLGFQLSFALATTLLLLDGGIRRLTSRPILRELARSLACSLVSLPFLLAQNHVFSWLSLVVNYFYSLLFSSFLIPILLILLVLHALGLANFFLGFQTLLGQSLHLLEKISLALSQWQGLTWVTGHLPAWLLFLYGLALVAVFACLQEGQVRRKAGLSLLSLLLVIYLWPNLKVQGQVSALAIGQGDCLLIRLPFNRGNYLIDAGSQPNFFDREPWQVRRKTSTVASRDILPALRAEGVRHLDGIFISHSDYDHYGSLAEICEKIPVDKLYLPIGLAQDEAILADWQGLTRQGWVWLRGGDRLRLGRQATFDIIQPDQLGEGDNEDSLVIWAELYGHSFLFTGDTEGQAEEAMAQRVQGRDLDYLKVAHHGSDHSSPAEVLAGLQPRHAVISVGQNNRYGHPSPRVLADLEAVGAQVWRTDQMGGIYYIFSPKSATIERTIQLEEGE